MTKLTEKFWIAYNIHTDEVYITTANKSYDGCYSATHNVLGVHIDDSDNLECGLYEVKRVLTRGTSDG